MAAMFAIKAAKLIERSLISKKEKKRKKRVRLRASRRYFCVTI